MNNCTDIKSSIAALDNYIEIVDDKKKVMLESNSKVEKRLDKLRKKTKLNLDEGYRLIERYIWTTSLIPAAVLFTIRPEISTWMYVGITLLGAPLGIHFIKACERSWDNYSSKRNKMECEIDSLEKEMSNNGRNIIAYDQLNKKLLKAREELAANLFMERSKEIADYNKFEDPTFNSEVSLNQGVAYAKVLKK